MRGQIARSARKEIEALDPVVAERILKRIESLFDEPRPSGAKKLEGSTDQWRFRFGDWRVVYRVDDKEKLVDISVVRHRREVYK
ncbi:MAG: type II toxin-antitoxin system RelE/ParE family toxin [Betaproteobacteria bacterium]|nr:type II toxin-antitoxin system RelE/ParE family toxin [Betaproteobacteria bacterium]